MKAKLQKHLRIATLAATALVCLSQTASANENHDGLGVYVSGSWLYSNDNSVNTLFHSSMNAATYGAGVSYQVSVTEHLKAVPFFMYNAFGNGNIQTAGAQIPFTKVSYAALGVEGRYMFDSGLYLGARLSGGRIRTANDAITTTVNGFTLTIPPQSGTSNTTPLLGIALGIELGNLTFGVYNDMGSISGNTQLKFGVYGAMLGWRF